MRREMVLPPGALYEGNRVVVTVLSVMFMVEYTISPADHTEAGIEVSTRILSPYLAPMTQLDSEIFAALEREMPRENDDAPVIEDHAVEPLAARIAMEETRQASLRRRAEASAAGGAAADDHRAVEGGGAWRDAEPGEGAEATPDLCAICIEACTSPVVLACEHMFCLACVKEWMTADGTNQTCPLCRAPVHTTETEVALAMSRGDDRARRARAQE